MTKSDLVCDPRQTIPTTVILPVECIDHIIGCLEYNKAILRRCALVCRLWASLCQQRLFNHIWLRIHAGSTQSDSERARQLLEILSRSSHIGEHIRNLQLTVYGGQFQGIRQTRQFSAEQRAMSQVLSQIHRLSSMSLNGPGERGFDFSPPLLKALGSTLTSPQLSHLSLSRWNLAGLKELTSLMGNHSWLLESLLLHEIHFGTPTNDEKAPNSEFITTINVLEVDSCDLLKIANWILSINISPLVKKLILINVDGESVLSFYGLFSSCLEELSLSRVYRDNLVAPLNFSDLPELRVLSLNEWALDHLVEELETFRRNNYLETLDIVPTVHDNTSVVSELKRLDRLLSSTHAFPSLKSVKIHIEVQSTETCEAVKEALGLLLERGLLHLKGETLPNPPPPKYQHLTEHLFSSYIPCFTNTFNNLITVDVIPRKPLTSLGADLFSTDFMNSIVGTLEDFDASVASTLEDFDALMFGPDEDITFETDSEQWYEGVVLDL